jgi:hypothetical protein
LIASSSQDRVREAYFSISTSVDYPESLSSEALFPNGCQQVVISSHPTGRVILRLPADVAQLCFWYMSTAARVTFHTQYSGIVNITHAVVQAAAATFDIRDNLLVRLSFDPRDTNSTVAVAYSPLDWSEPPPEFESAFSVGASTIFYDRSSGAVAAVVALPPGSRIRFPFGAEVQSLSKKAREVLTEGTSVKPPSAPVRNRFYHLRDLFSVWGPLQKPIPLTKGSLASDASSSSDHLRCLR